MPAGVTWGQYLKFTSCAMLAMMAGSQVVHIYYKPLKDLDVYIENEMEHFRASEMRPKSTDTSDQINPTTKGRNFPNSL